VAPKLSLVGDSTAKANQNKPAGRGEQREEGQRAAAEKGRGMGCGLSRAWHAVDALERCPPAAASDVFLRAGSVLFCVCFVLLLVAEPP